MLREEEAGIVTSEVLNNLFDNAHAIAINPKPLAFRKMLIKVAITAYNKGVKSSVELEPMTLASLGLNDDLTLIQ